MSKTLVDMAKVTQALDAGWKFELFKGRLGSYCIIADHPDAKLIIKRRDLLDLDGELVTDDFTPEQALTRAAYKCVDGIILDCEGGTSNAEAP